MLRLKAIGCDVLNREISYLSALSKCQVDVKLLCQGLHETPEKLREFIQKEIDEAEEGCPYNYIGTRLYYDYIVIGYGLCSNGIVGLKSRKTPLIVPRAHDCITLLLGSKQVYSNLFKANPGTYWFSSGWIERACPPSQKKYEALMKYYQEKYGEENAEYLIEVEQGWMKEYRKAAYISWECLKNNDYYADCVKAAAQYLKWEYQEYHGDKGVLERMLNGDFDVSEVLLVKPGHKVTESHDSNIIKSSDLE